VRAGWLASDVAAWAQHHLVEPRRLCLLHGFEVQTVRENGFGLVSLIGSSESVGRPRVRTARFIPQLLAASRERVLQALRATVASGSTAFVNAALYAGRVSRERGSDQRPVWTVWLSEDDALSDQVLALFAADALAHPLDYDSLLAVCDNCGAVSFSGTSSRSGCGAHPFGSVDGNRSGELLRARRDLARSS
jgi:hypothetical protein